MTVKAHEPNESDMFRLCDMRNIPVATNIATAEVPILFAASPFRATRSQPTNIMLTFPVCIRLDAALSQRSVVSNPAACISSAVSRAP